MKYQVVICDKCGHRNDSDQWTGVFRDLSAGPTTLNLCAKCWELFTSWMEEK